MPDPVFSVFVFDPRGQGYVVAPAKCTNVDPIPVAPVDVGPPVPLVASRDSAQGSGSNVVQAPRSIQVKCRWKRNWVHPLHHPLTDGKPPDGPYRWPTDCVVEMEVETVNVPEGTPVSIAVHHAPTRDDCPGVPQPNPDDVLADPFGFLQDLVVKGDRVVSVRPAPAVTPGQGRKPRRTGDGTQSSVKSTTRPGVKGVASRVVRVSDLATGNGIDLTFVKPKALTHIATTLSDEHQTAIRDFLQPILSDGRALYLRDFKVQLEVSGESGSTRRDTRQAAVVSEVESRFDALAPEFPDPDANPPVKLPDGVSAPVMVFNGSAHALWPSWKYPFYWFEVRVHLGAGDRSKRDTDLVAYTPRTHQSATPAIAASCLRLTAWIAGARIPSIGDAKEVFEALSTTAPFTTHAQAMGVAVFDKNVKAVAPWGAALSNTYALLQSTHGRVYLRTPNADKSGGPSGYAEYCRRWLPEEINPKKRKDGGLASLDVDFWTPSAFEYGLVRSIVYYGDLPDSVPFKGALSPVPTVITDIDVGDPQIVPSVPKVLAFLGACRSLAEPSLARSFLVRGTRYVIGYRVAVSGTTASNAVKNFMNAWSAGGLDPDAVPRLYWNHVFGPGTSLRPVLAMLDAPSTDAVAVDAAIDSLYGNQEASLKEKFGVAPGRLS